MRSLQQWRRQILLVGMLSFFTVHFVSADSLAGSIADALTLVFGPQGLFGVLQSQYVAWGITVISIFLILYHVFLSVLKRVPLFKGEGGVAASSSGKTVAIALSLISSLGIFYGTGADGFVVIRILQWMGRYGVVVFMIIIFYTTYHFLKGLHPSLKMKHVALAVALFLAGFLGVSLLQHMQNHSSAGVYSFASLAMIAGIIYFPIALVKRPSAKQEVKEEQRMGNDLQQIDRAIQNTAHSLPQTEKQEHLEQQNLKQEVQQEQQEHLDEMKIAQLLQHLLAAVKQPGKYSSQQLLSMYQQLAMALHQGEQLMQRLVDENKQIAQHQWEMIKTHQHQLHQLNKLLQDFVERYDDLSSILKKANLQEYGITKELINGYLKRWELLEQKILEQESSMKKDLQQIDTLYQEMITLRKNQKELLVRREPSSAQEQKVLHDALKLQSKILGYHQEIVHHFSSLAIDLQQLFLELQALKQTAQKIHVDIQAALQQLGETEQATLQQELFRAV